MKASLVIAACLVLIAFTTTLEGTLAVVFGWIPFLGRVLPEVKPDGPSVTAGVFALVLFAVGVHWLGRSRREAWRVRWTGAIVLGVLLLFTAGISLIGITHQLAWLARSEQPLLGEGLQRAHPENRMKELAMGLGQYQDINNRFPSGGMFTPDGEMLHSWETHILPFIGITPQGINMQRPWNGPENRTYFQCVLPTFINPDFRTPPLEDRNKFGLSHYAANSRVMAANKSVALSDLTNDASNTILIGEVNVGFKPWGHPVNWRDPAAGLNRGAATFGGAPSTNGVRFLMADGSVRYFSNTTDPSVLRGLSNAGKE